MSMEGTGASPRRIAIVSEHASAKFGGEAALPLHYFRVLRRLGHEVWLVTHARTHSWETVASKVFEEFRQIAPQETLLPGGERSTARIHPTGG